MSDTNDNQAPSIPIPDGWADMSDDEQREYVAAALTKIAQETGVIDPADAEPLGDGDSNIADETPAPDETPDDVDAGGETVRVFREPGQE